MGEETVKDPEKGTDRDVSGAVVRIPVPRTLTYDVGKQMTFASLGIDCGYSILPAAGLALSVVGEDVVITFLPGTTTLANVQAALAADPVAKEMLSLTGTAGTLPVGWAGGVGKLYNDLYAEAVAMLAQDSEGNWVPFSGKSLVVDVKMDAFAAVPDSALSVGTEDGLATGVKHVMKVTPTSEVASVPYLPVAGAAPSTVVGTTGRMNKDVIFTIDAGMTATVHPLRGSVSVIFNTAAAAAVTATGKVVTLTAKNAPALTDITAMNVLIAASATVSALIGPLVGTGADTFDAALAIAETPLWESGTIPANLACRMGSDGYNHPACLVEGWQYRSAAAEACASILATPGTILRGMVYNQGGALAYLQFHDLAAPPAPAAVPAFVLGEIAAGETVPWPVEVHGAVGLQVCLSSTRDTYTAFAFGRSLLWVE